MPFIEAPGPEPFLIADHPALDLMITRARADGTEVDFLRSDADVARWLKKTGWLAEGAVLRFERNALLDAARALREAIRPLVAWRKEGKRPEAAVLKPLNRFLAAGHTRPEWVWDGEGGPRLEKRREARTPEQVLAPLAESAAELLSAGDFGLVRCCADSECVLWFYDRTKSHRRRWCSMAVCGNRNKVAAFRQRKQD